MLGTVFCWLLVLGLATPRARAAFGDPLTHGRDDVFEKMGQAKVDKFEVEEGQVTLDISLEDTEGQDEIWVLDFQDFAKPNAQNTQPVTQNNGGALVAELTGTCSSVFTTVAYNNLTGFYKDDFRPVVPGTKSLFNSYQTTNTYVQKGDIKVRVDHVMFDGSIDTMFKCLNTDNVTVWHKEVTSDTIEFNTTLYMTNIRPQGSISNPEPAYVQSFAVLYWRLLRVALSRFLISSSERLKPIFEYAVVRPVYLNDDGESFDRQRAEVEIAFRTVTSHPNGSLVSVFKSDSLTYSPADLLINNRLLHIKKVPPTGCDLPLGMTNKDIADHQIMASTMWLDSEEYSGDKGRLKAVPEGDISAGAWVAGIADADQWIQVDLGVVTWCSGVQTQGYIDGDIIMWVTQYQVAYSTVDSGPLSLISNDDGFPTVFDGNYDGETIVTNYFTDPIQAKRIRILPQAWDNSIALRLELLGCDELSECFTLGDESDYRGTVSVAVSGDACQQWTSSEPHDTNINVDDHRADGLGDHNFCRSFNGTDIAYCYTRNPDAQVVPCDVGEPQPFCPPSVYQPKDTYPQYAPYCNYTEWNGQCTQRWVFIIVLEVDTSAATNGMPIDATGEFTFKFVTYDCANNNNDRSSCRKLEIPEAIISNEITLQTTVEVTDDVMDSPRVYLKKVHGSDPTVDIRGGVPPGVSHLEQVTVDAHFFPQFLRNRLQLELTLFMVCIGSEYNTGDGCLASPLEDTYTAYVAPSFTYRVYTNPADLTQYTDLVADDMSTSSQTLDYYTYIHSSEVHRTIFTNKALSAKAQEYTITTVYRLVERTVRRRRGVARRDVQDKVDEPIIIHHAILFKGCPPNSTHDAKDLACICTNEGEEYSVETFSCKKPRPFVLDETILPVDESGPGADSDEDLVGENNDSGAPSAKSSTLLVYLLAVIIASLAFWI